MKKIKKNRNVPASKLAQSDRNIIEHVLTKLIGSQENGWINKSSTKSTRNSSDTKIKKCIERTKNKLLIIIAEYNVDHIDNKEKTSAYRLADNLYRKYNNGKKDGLTLLEIKTLNKFYE